MGARPISDIVPASAARASMSATTATLTATLHLAGIASPAPDPYAGDPSPPPATAVDPQGTSVPAPDGDAWTPPPPPAQQPADDPPPLGLPPEPAELPTPATPPSDAGKRTMTIGLVFLGVGIAAGVATVYAFREYDRTRDRLAAEDAYNAGLMMAGLPTSDTGDLRDDVQTFRDLTIGLGVTTGVLVLVGGAVMLAGVGQRRRAARVTLRPGGLALQF